MTDSRSIFDLEELRRRLAEIESIIGDENLWNDPDKAKTILKERASVAGRIEGWQDLYKDV